MNSEQLVQYEISVRKEFVAAQNDELRLSKLMSRKSFASLSVEKRAKLLRRFNNAVRRAQNATQTLNAIEASKSKDE